MCSELHAHPMCKYGALCTALTNPVGQIALLVQVVRKNSAPRVDRMGKQSIAVSKICQHFEDAAILGRANAILAPMYAKIADCSNFGTQQCAIADQFSDELRHLHGRQLLRFL